MVKLLTLNQRIVGSIPTGGTKTEEMSSSDYWKNVYKNSWDISTSKENNVKSIIEKETGFIVEMVGLGAGSSKRVDGSARKNGMAKGDADLYIKDADCYVEVTGPNIKMDFDRPLWIRPDKLNNVYHKRERGVGKLHVIVHVLKQKNDEDVMRVIVLDDLFFDHLLTRKSFEMVYPTIRGRQEKYVELPPEHEVIISMEDFISRL